MRHRRARWGCRAASNRRGHLRRTFPKVKKVLVADDDRVTVQLLTTHLRKAGYEVVQAFDAMQAFMFAQRESPSAVVVDVNMPGGSGLNVLSRLKASAKHGQVPVIAMSVSTDPKLPDEALRLGADAFLRKPVNNDELATLIERLLADA